MRPFLQLFSVVVLFLLAASQLIHGVVDHGVMDSHDSAHTHNHSDHHDSRSDEGEPSETHHCCHAHSPAAWTISDSMQWMVGNILCGRLTDVADLLPESPVAEIDYPPQLS